LVPLHRVEVFNSIRQLVHHPEPERRLRLAEAKALIHRIETDVRLGYFTHLEADWRDVLRTANELSIAHGFGLACRAADLLHVAYANELAAEAFVSFDDEQLALAQASGWGLPGRPNPDSAAPASNTRQSVNIGPPFGENSCSGPHVDH